MDVALQPSQSAQIFSDPQYSQSLIPSSCRPLHPFIMPSSPFPTGKRPELKESRSAGWSWPRLVPIHEQQLRSSQASHSSASPPLRDHIEQEEPPTTTISTMIPKLHKEEDAPLSPVLSATGSSPIGGGSVAGTVKHEPSEFPRSSLSSTRDSGDEERAVAGSQSGSVKGLGEHKRTDSEGGPIQDATNAPASASERTPVDDEAEQGAERVPVGCETTSMYSWSE